MGPESDRMLSSHQRAEHVSFDTLTGRSEGAVINPTHLSNGKVIER